MCVARLWTDVYALDTVQWRQTKRSKIPRQVLVIDGGDWTTDDASSRAREERNVWLCWGSEHGSQGSSLPEQESPRIPQKGARAAHKTPHVKRSQNQVHPHLASGGAPPLSGYCSAVFPVKHDRWAVTTAHRPLVPPRAPSSTVASHCRQVATWRGARSPRLATWTSFSVWDHVQNSESRYCCGCRNAVAREHVVNGVSPRTTSAAGGHNGLTFRRHAQRCSPTENDKTPSEVCAGGWKASPTRT